MMALRKIVLFVEDNKQDEVLTVRALKKYDEGIQISVCRDGLEALDWLFMRGQYEGRDRDLIPQVVLLDLKLPKLNGHDVLKALRNDPRTKSLPVVILTTSKEEKDLNESYDNGANSYVQKPVSYDDFSEAVKSLGSYWLKLNEIPKLPLPDFRPL
jgi:two-component system response regulator